MPKIGFHNFAYVIIVFTQQLTLWDNNLYGVLYCRQRNFQTVSLTKIQEFIDMGRLKVKEGEMITMRDLYMAGIATGIDDGIKLLAGVSWLQKS